MSGLKKQVCSTCGAEGMATIPNLGHNYEAEEVVEATCTTAGSITQHCSSCNEVHEIIIPAMGHTYTSQVIKPATNTTEGVELLTCFCGEHKYKAIEKLSDNQMVILITGKEDVNKETVNKENVDNEDTNKEIISNESIGNEDINKENANKDYVDNQYVPNTSSKTVVCVLLMLLFVVAVNIITNVIRVYKRRKNNLSV